MSTYRIVGRKAPLNAKNFVQRIFGQNISDVFHEISDEYNLLYKLKMSLILKIYKT